MRIVSVVDDESERAPPVTGFSSEECSAEKI